MKYGAGHPFADPEAAARKLVESPGSIKPMQNGRIFFGIINGPFLCGASGTGRNFRTGLTFAVERDWIKRHESCTHVRLTGLRPELGLYYLSSAKQSALALGCFAGADRP